jgi:hypothetical protein
MRERVFKEQTSFSLSGVSQTGIELRVVSPESQTYEASAPLITARTPALSITAD